VINRIFLFAFQVRIRITSAGSSHVRSSNNED
jgi:hypothetical protein